MKVFIFASGSGGNCLLVSDKGTNILIDAGISMRRIESCLLRADISMEDITGVLITHEHSDHVSALKTMSKKYKVSIFAPHTVASRVIGMLPETEDLIRIIPVEEYFGIGNLWIRAFHTSHDTDESVGYRVEGCGSFAVATDTGCITKEMETELLGTEAVLIESNHDEDMLRYGPYPPMLKRRILSEHGHLSNEDCACFAKELALSGTETIVLGHLSKMNNTPEKALNASEKMLAGTNVHLLCAPEFGNLIITVGEKRECLR